MGAVVRFVRRLWYGRPIVVVSGLPRSGTSMMMQMLQAGGVPILTDSVRGPDDSNPRGYLELEAVKDLDKGVALPWLAEARGKAVKVVSSLVHWLPDTFNYRVIFMARDLDEVMASQAKMLAARGTPPDESQDGQVRRGYQAHVEDALRRLRARAAFSVLVVDYAEALARPDEAARRIDHFLGGGLDVTRMAAVADPALHRNRGSAG